MLTKYTKGLVVPLSLCLCIAANGGPSISRPNIGVVDCSLSPSCDSHVSSVPEVIQVTESNHAHFTNAARQYLKPPTSLANSTNPAIGGRSLPAVPGAVLMVAAGFACISLVRDRKVWLAALAGLLWAGQAGMQALPQLASQLSANVRGTEQQRAAGLAYPFRVEESSRLRSDIEGTQYIGLLRHLAGIPDAAVPFVHNREFTQANDKSRASVSAIIPFSSSLIAAAKCPALNAEHFTCFSPASVFETLPRGPPLLV